VLYVGEVAPSARRAAQTNQRASLLTIPKGHQSSFGDGRRTIHTQLPIAHYILMSSPLLDVWEAAAGSPYQPTIGKNTQFTVGFVLLFSCMLAWLWSYRGALLMTRSPPPQRWIRPQYAPTRFRLLRIHTHNLIDKSLVNLPILGIPASIAFGYVFTTLVRNHFLTFAASAQST
jgi:hypothetical protein